MGVATGGGSVRLTVINSLVISGCGDWCPATAETVAGSPDQLLQSPTGEFSLLSWTELFTFIPYVTLKKFNLSFVFSVFSSVASHKKKSEKEREKETVLIVPVLSNLHASFSSSYFFYKHCEQVVHNQWEFFLWIRFSYWGWYVWVSGRRLWEPSPHPPRLLHHRQCLVISFLLKTSEPFDNV